MNPRHQSPSVESVTWEGKPQMEEAKLLSTGQHSTPDNVSTPMPIKEAGGGWRWRSHQVQKVALGKGELILGVGVTVVDGDDLRVWVRQVVLVGR